MLNVNCNCDDSVRTTKNIYVFANGRKYSGRKVVLNQKRWHHILSQITFKLDPYFGKVEKLYTTSSGLTVYSFSDLENNAAYVASDRYRKYSHVKGGYTLDTEQAQEYFEHYLSSQLHRINKNKKLVYVRRDLLVIYIFRNGECWHAFKIVLTSDDLSSWSHILSYIALTIDAPERCIKSLYSVNGNRICGPWELQHGASYVAVGYNETFRKGCYQMEHKSKEMLLTGFPVVHRDKNLACEHKPRRKFQQNFKWCHYNQYTCTTGAPSKASKHFSKKSKSKSKTSKKVKKKESKTVSKSTSKTESLKGQPVSDKNKKVTVHMRIKNPATSNITISRNSGDKPSKTKMKKRWNDSSSQSTSDSKINKHSDGCRSGSSKKKHKKKCHSRSTTTESSSSDYSPKCGEKKKKQERNLTWKHMKKTESQNSTKQPSKCVVKVKNAKACLLGLSDSEDSSTERKRGHKKHDSKSHKKHSKKLEKKSSIIKDKKTKDSCTCVPSEPVKKEEEPCMVRSEQRFHIISKKGLEAFKPSCCPKAPTLEKPKPKFNNTIFKLSRDDSQSRNKNRNCVITCTDPQKCKGPKQCGATQKKTNFVKKIASFLYGSSSSMDSIKRRSRQRIPTPDTDTEDSYKMKLCQPKQNAGRGHSKKNSGSNKSVCNICHFQQVRRYLNKKY